MEIIYGIKNIRRYNSPVVAIGVFDGLHRGHRKILLSAVKKARRIHGTSMVVTLFPHPQKEDSLSSLKHRLRLIEELGIGVCIVVGFNKAFSKISAQDFIKKILVKKINARYVYIGTNFRFGRNAQGDIRVLKEFAAKNNFGLKVFNLARHGIKTVSSSFIRRLIKRGSLDTAGKLLLRPVSVFGKVTRGSSRARKMGFPTANIKPQHEVLPPAGVYAAEAFLNHRKIPAVCYIGTRPTFSAGPKRRKVKFLKPHVEAHIINFNRDIYNKELEIRFMKRLRAEKKFASVEALSKQIKKDLNSTRKFFALH
jgi:riboflavin kinase/FMN adenylyltransferase